MGLGVASKGERRVPKKFRVKPGVGLPGQGGCSGGRPTVLVVWIPPAPWLIPGANGAGQGVPGSIPGPRVRPGQPLTAFWDCGGTGRAGWERPHAQLIRPVASLGDVFCVEKSWETSWCGTECTWRHTPGTGLRPALHSGSTWAHLGPAEAWPGSLPREARLKAAGGGSKGLWGGPKG